MRQHPLRVFVDQLLDRASQLGLDLVVAVGLENRSLGFHHLGKGPIADALSVRQRSSLPPIHQLSAVARYVVSPTRMPFTGAADWRRAAVLTTSPAAMPSPASGRAARLTSASPVFTAIRTCSLPSSAIQSRIASAARTARSGSSS